MRFQKAVYVVVGCMCVGLGAIGAVVPILPSFPFLMLATVCFTRSSERLHTWFTNTKLYKDNLADYVAGNGMTWGAKLRIMLTVTALISFGFAMMLSKGLHIPCVILGVVWLSHIVYFVFGVKTLKVC